MVQYKSHLKRASNHPPGAGEIWEMSTPGITHHIIKNYPKKINEWF